MDEYEEPALFTVFELMSKQNVGWEEIESFKIALECQQRGDFGAAILAYFEAIKRNSRYEIWFNLACCQKALEQTDDAIQSFHRVLEFEPRFKDAYAQLAMLYRKKGLIEQSEYYRLRAAQCIN